MFSCKAISTPWGGHFFQKLCQCTYIMYWGKGIFFGWFFRPGDCLGFLRSTDQEYTVYLSHFVIFVHEFLGIIRGIIDMIITTSFLPDVVFWPVNCLTFGWKVVSLAQLPMDEAITLHLGVIASPPFSMEWNLVPLIGGIRWYIIPQLAVYTTYIPYHLYYCLLLGDYISLIPPIKGTFRNSCWLFVTRFFQGPNSPPGLPPLFTWLRLKDITPKEPNSSTLCWTWSVRKQKDVTLGSSIPSVKSGWCAGLQGGPGKHGVIKPYISIGLEVISLFTHLVYKANYIGAIYNSCYNW